MNLTALKIDVFVQYTLLIVMIISFCSLFGIFLAIALEVSLGIYQSLHVLYFGFVLQKDWAKQHLAHIGIFIIIGIFLAFLGAAVDSLILLAMAYITLVPIAMAAWYCHKVRQHYKIAAQLPTSAWEDEDILDANLDQF